MLRALAIRDFVIVDFVELDLSSGFTVFTGETGAGKSILIDALTLALGGRADASVVREGATRADIVAEFTGEQDSVIQHWLNEQALDHGEGVLLLRRVIDNAGRSKAFINGVTATVTQLRELGEMLVDIHGQHAHQSLLRGDAQRQLVDAHAGLQAQVQKVASAYKQWRAVGKQREEFERDAKQALLERERLEWQVGELQKLSPQAGEWADVCNEHSRLSHAASLIDGAQQALDALSESDSSPMLSQLNSLTQRLGKLVDIDDKLKPVLDALEPARIQLQEAVYVLHDYLGRIELDPQRLRVVEARMEALHSASRKFHVAPEQLSQEFEQLSMRLQQLSDATDLDALRAQEHALAEAYHASAKLLSKARAAAAKSLSAAVTAAMQELSMSGGRFDIALHTIEPAAHGVEQIEFLVAGHVPWPKLHRVASWRVSRSRFR